MGNSSSLRCCLACVLPCGALDLIRIVHLNGFVDEITGPITAGDILNANPNHILTKPTSQGGAAKILILSPDSGLKRGTIYFLIPSTSLPPEIKNRRKASSHSDDHDNKKKKQINMPTCRRSRESDRNIQVWRPHLDSISED